ncbi:hypothetical protein FRC00_007710, partial [Tulasnella sp. 408]
MAIPKKVKDKVNDAKRIELLERELAAAKAAMKPDRWAKGGKGGKTKLAEGHQGHPSSQDSPDNELINSVFGGPIPSPAKHNGKGKQKEVAPDVPDISQWLDDPNDPWNKRGEEIQEEEEEEEEEDVNVNRGRDRDSDDDYSDDEDDDLDKNRDNRNNSNDNDDDESNNGGHHLDDDDSQGRASSEEASDEDASGEENLPLYNPTTGQIRKPPGEAGRSSSAKHAGYNLQRAMGLGSKDKGWRNKQYNQYTTTNRRLANLYFDTTKPYQRQDAVMKGVFHAKVVKNHPGLQDWYENGWPVQAMAQQFLRNTAAQQKHLKEQTFEERDPRDKEQQAKSGPTSVSKPQQPSKTKEQKIAKPSKPSRPTAPDGTKINYIVIGERNISKKEQPTGPQKGPPKVSKAKPVKKATATTTRTSITPQPSPKVNARPRPRPREKTKPGNSGKPSSKSQANAGQPEMEVQNSPSTIKTPPPPPKPSKKKSPSKRTHAAMSNSDEAVRHPDDDMQTPGAGPSNSSGQGMDK